MAFAALHTDAQDAMRPRPEQRLLTRDRSPHGALRAPPRARRVALRRSRPARCATARA
jgi:hypothetical protein